MLTSTTRVLNSFLKLKDSLPMRYMCHTLAELAIITVHARDFRGKFSLIHNELSWPISVVQYKLKVGRLDLTIPGTVLMSTCETENSGLEELLDSQRS